MNATTEAVTAAVTGDAVDRAARWDRIKAMIDRIVARNHPAPDDVEAALIGAFVRAQEAEEKLARSPCLLKAEPGEPVFTLRARDALAMPLVRLWASLAGSVGAREEKVNGAHDIADAMAAWETKKWPD